MSNEFYSSANPTTNGVEQAIKRMDWDEPEKYRVEWESSEKWQFDSAYAVKEIRFGGSARAMMLLIGPRGGEYLIDANPAGQPRVRKQRSDGYESEDRLAEIRIFSEDFNWRHRVLRAIEEASEKVPNRS
ncbi:hypothetical protein HWV07_17545 [Natronomonas salina]|uniref:hypothetical protein n=1 Tax=Natronomonas salina TaxID=1710540 RepID=UPI0015B75483|nr:hypothetical protein [Natronomonas salina]QLD90750.1 hypothetical protein HWV07_17545 [Natronomonas salina]